MDAKKDIRREVLARRDSLSKTERSEKSRAIINALVTLPQFECSETIYCYVDYRSEVETHDFIMCCFSKKKKVAVPKICGDDMRFFYINSLEELEYGYRGILEPKTSHPAHAEHALVIMPGAVFDQSRNRIGYGKGFYDKFLYRHPDYATIALAFSCQIIPVIPSKEHDIKPDIIITEECIYESITE